MVNLPAKYTQKDTLRYKGGGAWGGLPLPSLLAAVSRPPNRGCHGHPPTRETMSHPFGCHGNHGPWTQGHAQDKPNRFGVGPKAHGPPLLGGGDTLARGSLGVRYLPGCSLGNPPRMAPPNLGARLCRLLVVTMPILQICTSHIVDRVLPIFRTFLGVYSSRSRVLFT